MERIERRVREVRVLKFFDGSLRGTSDTWVPNVVDVGNKGDVPDGRNGLTKKEWGGVRPGNPSGGVWESDPLDGGPGEGRRLCRDRCVVTGQDGGRGTSIPDID